jgi:H+-translocating NAD(P) transhydrogenase subunit beta
VGGVLAWVSGKRVAITDMPQMVALYNGLGGGAAAAIGAVELRSSRLAAHASPGMTVLVLATLGALIGSSR